MILSGEIHHQLANSKADYLVTLPPMLSKVQEAIGHLDIQVDLEHQMNPPFCLDDNFYLGNLPHDYSSVIMIPGCAGRRD